MEKISFSKKLSTSYCIKISDNGKYLAHIGSKTSIYGMDIMNKIASFSDIKNPGSIDFSRDSQFIQIKNTSGKIGLFNLENLSYVNSYISIKTSGPEDCNSCFTPDNKYIIDGVNGNSNGTIALINIESKKTTIIKRYEDCIIKSIEYNDETEIYTFVVFKRGTELNDESGIGYSFFVKWRYPFDKYPLEEVRFPGKHTFKYIKISNINKCYVFYDWDRVVIIDQETKEELKNVNFEKNCGYFCTLDFSLDGKYIALAFSECIKVIRFKDLKCIKEYRLKYSCYVGFSKDVRYLLIGTWNNGYCIKMDDILKEEFK